MQAFDADYPLTLDIRPSWFRKRKAPEPMSWAPVAEVKVEPAPAPVSARRALVLARLMAAIGPPGTGSLVWASNDDAAAALGVAKGTASKWISEAVKAKVLVRKKIGKRVEIHRVWSV